MKIYKEWFIDGYLDARFYSCTLDGRTYYFIDYSGCEETAELDSVISSDGKWYFKSEFDVPEQYLHEATGYVSILKTLSSMASA